MLIMNQSFNFEKCEGYHVEAIFKLKIHSLQRDAFSQHWYARTLPVFPQNIGD
jgi:hypothetical protein